MDLFSVLNTSRESMVSHGTALSSVADNLANTNTPGFKEKRVEFGDLLSESMGGIYSSPNSSGAGVRVDNVQSLHVQGAIEPTSNEMDFAITGDGFFIVSDGENEYYTRAGNFRTNKNGEIETQDGLKVMGYSLTEKEKLVPLNVGSVDVKPTPTTFVNLNGNLDVGSEIVSPKASYPTFKELNKDAEFKHGVEVIDSLGKRNDVSLYFFHSKNQEWTVQAYISKEDETSGKVFPELLGSTKISFDGEGKQINDASSLELSISSLDGGASSSFKVDLSKFTSVSAKSNVSSLEVDGLRSGSVTSIELNPDGILRGKMDNGSYMEIGNVAVAKFSNPTSLIKKGSNLFITSQATSKPIIGKGGEEGRGTLANFSLESSNIDPSKQFTDIIRFQRGYQGSSKAFTTASELINTTLQIA